METYSSHPRTQERGTRIKFKVVLDCKTFESNSNYMKLSQNEEKKSKCLGNTFQLEYLFFLFHFFKRINFVNLQACCVMHDQCRGLKIEGQVPSFQQVGSGDWTQVVRFGSKHLSVLSPLAGPSFLLLTL